MQSKKNDSSLDPSNKIFSNDNLIREILSSTEITNVDYYWTVSILPETDDEIRVKRSSGSRFISTITQFYLRHRKWIALYTKFKVLH